MVICNSIIIEMAGLEVTALNLELPSPGTGQAIAYVTVTGYGSGFVRIDWGDGHEVRFAVSAGTWEMTHLYVANGTYSVCAGIVD